MPFGWCPCALFIELLFTSLEAYHCRGDISSSCMVHITSIIVICVKYDYSVLKCKTYYQMETLSENWAEKPPHTHRQ